MLLEIRNLFYKNFNIRFWCTLLMTLIWSLNAVAQAPLVKIWDYRYGGTGDDQLYAFQLTKDGGYILGGFSNSGITGDKSEDTRGNYDFWLVKLDSTGHKEWDKDFGGALDDGLNSLQQTEDGGYILGGYSRSGISGDKTQDTWGFFDYWILRLDANGNKIWDKDFGGTGDDRLLSLQETTDEGFILGGWSTSDISGNKSEPLKGAPGDFDYWIIKIDSLGNKQWEKDLGGTDSDLLYIIKQTTDSGFIAGGFSQSDTGGDKSSSVWGQPGIDRDIWIIKLDASGNKIWDRDFGGTSWDEVRSIEQTKDGGYLVGGWSASDISGNKTNALWGGSGDIDHWIIKTDSFGVMQWNRDIGGTDRDDDLGSIHQQPDGSYFISGSSYSDIGGVKTENNLGIEQNWIYKTDSSGNIIWDKTILNYGHDEMSLAVQTLDGCYTVANFTPAGVGGYKSQPGWGVMDYWIIKFCDSTQIPLAAFNSPTLICPGTCVDFVNQSNFASTYQWMFPNAIPDTSTALNPQNICYANPGTYNVQLVAINSYGFDTLMLSNYINVYPFPQAQSITQGGDTLFAISGALSYQWYFNGSLIPGATSYFYVAPISGDYNVVATDTNGCEVEAAIFNVIAGLSPALYKGEGFFVSPNPVEDELEIKNEKLKIEAGDMTVYDVMGKCKLNKHQSGQIHSSGEIKLDVSGLAPGVYWLEITNKEKIYRTKFIRK